MSRIPKIRWVQRKGMVYVTFEVPNPSEVNIDYTDTTLQFKAVDSETSMQYAVTVVLFSTVMSKGCRHHLAPKYVRVTLPKAPVFDWDRLTLGPAKDVKHFIQYDWDMDNALQDDPEPVQDEGGADDDDEPTTVSSKDKKEKPSATTNAAPAAKPASSDEKSKPSALSGEDREKIRRVKEELEKEMEEAATNEQSTVELTRNEIVGLVSVVSVVTSLVTFFFTRWIYYV
eukprot:PhF_6_TR11295/c1_g1_i1/m.18227